MPPSTALVESHEDRIQRLESDIPDLTASVIKLDGKVEIVCVQQKDLGDKMDKLQDLMGQHVKTSSDNYERMFGRVDTLEKSKIQIDGAKKALGWAAKPAFIVLGAGLIKFGEFLFALLHLGS